ncbi:MAG: iron-sulfur cluster repair di-iron protein [Hyphomicrobiaceae bacterium]
MTPGSIPHPSDAKTVGEIAATLAGAATVFRRHRIDFCCGGDVSLDAAARARGVDPDVVRAELAALAEMPTEAPHESNALVGYILSRYHDTHRRELPELRLLAGKVEAAHRTHTEVPAGLAQLLARAQHELEDHMRKEEQILFPAIRSDFKGSLFGPITVMRHEHDSHAELIHALQATCRNFVLPKDACRSWQGLYRGVEKLVTDLMEHINLENTVLFPRFEYSR